MNKTQRLVLMIGVAVVLAVTLFPPRIYQPTPIEWNTRFPGNHMFVLFSSADLGSTLKKRVVVSAWIDIPRLAAELAGVVLATAGLVLALWSRTDEKAALQRPE